MLVQEGEQDRHPEIVRAGGRIIIFDFYCQHRGCDLLKVRRTFVYGHFMDCRKQLGCVQLAPELVFIERDVELAGQLHRYLLSFPETCKLMLSWIKLTCENFPDLISCRT